MTLTITINELTDTDFDGNPITFKQAMCNIDGIAVMEAFSCNIDALDETVTSDVRAKLAARGYEFD